MPGYNYHGLMASTWDIWRDDTASWQDRSFYADIVGRYGEPVLHPGAGARGGSPLLRTRRAIVISRQARYVILQMAAAIDRDTIRMPARLGHRTR